MIIALLTTLKIFSWIGLVLGLCASVNIIGKTISNVQKGEKFSWKKMFLGIGKVMLMWALAFILALACTILPYINIMIVNAYGVVLVSDEILNTLSVLSIVGIGITAIAKQGKKALEAIKSLDKNL